jgi:hypothetical protein
MAFDGAGVWVKIELPAALNQEREGMRAAISPLSL